MCLQNPSKKCSDIHFVYTEIKSYSIGQIFLIITCIYKNVVINIFLLISMEKNRAILYIYCMLVREIWKCIHPRVSYSLRATSSVDILLFGRYNHVSTSYKSYNCIILKENDELHEQIVSN